MPRAPDRRAARIGWRARTCRPRHARPRRPYGRAQSRVRRAALRTRPRKETSARARREATAHARELRDEALLVLAARAEAPLRAWSPRRRAPRDRDGRC